MGLETKTKDRFILALSIAALFLSSLLLFLIEPISAKKILPHFGGANSTWSICLVFFQIMLLIGYLSAVFISKINNPAVFGLILAVLFALPFLGLAELTLSYTDTTQANPYIKLFVWLAKKIALPFIALSSVTTIVQHCFSKSSHPKANNPYFLYSASNLGSISALFSYPFLIEPNIAISMQLYIWRLLYILAALMLILCCYILLTSKKPTDNILHPTTRLYDFKALPNFWSILGLSGVPSGILLSLSSYIQTDLGSLPLLWILPLFLYLSSFIIAFSITNLIPIPKLVQISSLLTAVCIVGFLLDTSEPVLMLISIHLVNMLTISVVCHSLMAKLAPVKDQLPNYYLTIALGGALGGLGTLLLGPLIFSRPYEYVVLLALSFMLSAPKQGLKINLRSLATPLILVFNTWITNQLSVQQSSFALILTYLPSVLIAYSLRSQQVLYSIALLSILAAGLFVPNQLGRTVLSKRSFYGAIRVLEQTDPLAYAMLNGSTVHGSELKALRNTCTPSTYYSSTGPLGRALFELKAERPILKVGVIGLGVGSIACHARSQDDYTFFELSPIVKTIAKNPKYFTLLQSVATDYLKIIIGDGRAELNKFEETFDLLIIDAFSSDSIPVHLLTVEALELYQNRINKDGLVLFHISNRYYELGSELAALAKDRNLKAWINHDLNILEHEVKNGKYPSLWGAISKNDDQRLIRAGYKELKSDGRSPWRDELADTLRTLSQLF